MVYSSCNSNHSDPCDIISDKEITTVIFGSARRHEAYYKYQNPSDRSLYGLGHDINIGHVWQSVQPGRYLLKHMYQKVECVSLSSPQLSGNKQISFVD